MARDYSISIGSSVLDQSSNTRQNVPGRTRHSAAAWIQVAGGRYRYWSCSDVLVSLHIYQLGHLSHGEIAALVGVAPFDNDSGKYTGHRTIKGGRSQVRTALYMATLSAMRHNPAIRAYYAQLKTGGKLEKVAIVACMRKLLHFLNAMVRKQRAWVSPATQLWSIAA
jgi:transposase